MCTGCGKTRHFKKVCGSRRDRAVHELEIKEMPEYDKGKIEMVSINLVHLSRIHSLLTAKLEMQSGGNTIVIPYKIDTGSKGNIVPLFIFKNCLKMLQKQQLQKTIKSYMRLRMYNKTNITQLGMCAVVIKFRNIKKSCVFFVVPENG